MNFFPHPYLQRKPKAKVSKHKFSKEEDEQLAVLCKKFSYKWSVIAQNMKGRNARQCRDRWNNYLSPAIDNSNWTQEEDDNLLKCFWLYGNHWTFIATKFNKRTSVSVRNRCLKLMRSKGIIDFSGRIQNINFWQNNVYMNTCQFSNSRPNNNSNDNYNYFYPFSMQLNPSKELQPVDPSLLNSNTDSELAFDVPSFPQIQSLEIVPQSPNQPINEVQINSSSNTSSVCEVRPKPTKFRIPPISSFQFNDNFDIFNL